MHVMVLPSRISGIVHMLACLQKDFNSVPARWQITPQHRIIVMC